MFRPIIALTLICVISALVLGLTYSVTKPLIAAQQEAAQNVDRVLPSADRHEKKSLDAKEYYEGYKNNKLIGYALFSKGEGYSGIIELFVGIDTDGRIINVEVLSQTETPGLGAQCIEIRQGEKDPWFLRQFRKRKASELNLKNIEAITGATITTEAIIKALKQEVSTFLRKVKE